MRTFSLRSARNRQGFTLVEVMFVVLVGMIIMAAVTGVFITHSRTYTVHDDIAAMQQDLRGALMIMPAEMRLAGCNPTGQADGEFVPNADSTTFEFRADIGGRSKNEPNEADGELDAPGERVAFKFCPNTDQCVLNNDLKCPDTRNTPGVGVICRVTQKADERWEPDKAEVLAGDIERMEFHYIIRKGKKLEIKSKPGAAERERISAVQISILARSNFGDDRFQDTTAAYYPASNPDQDPTKTAWRLEDIYSSANGASPNDLERARHHRRRMVITTVQLRNLNLGN